MPHRNDASSKGWAAFDRTVRWAVEAIGCPATFDEIAAILPAGVHYPLILGSLRTFAECRGGLWQIPAADVVTLPSRAMSAATRKTAAA